MHRRALLAILLAPAAFPAFAQTYGTVLPAADKVLVDRAAAYLQGVKMARGRFSQTSPRGSISTGTLYLSRPGRARFEYDAPAALLVVADGRNVSVFDRRLKSFERYPLGATPLALFLSRRVKLDEDVMVTRVARSDGGFSITLRDSHKPNDGSLTLDFGDSPMSLRGWTVIDPQAQKTEVRIEDLTPVGSLDSALFVLDKPAAGGRP